MFHYKRWFYICHFLFGPVMSTVAASVLVVSAMIYVYKSVKPPPPKICGTPNGPPISSPRIKLNDGRHLAYRERGVAKEHAKYKVILVHGFDSSKDIYLPLSQVCILNTSHSFSVSGYYKFCDIYLLCVKVAPVTFFVTLIRKLFEVKLIIFKIK